MQLPSELVPEHPKFNKIEKSYYTCLYAPYTSEPALMVNGLHLYSIF